ncbi:MAG: histidine kinase [Sphingomonadales bacterium]|nr:histidine kinase [Sphingomonadales bacterium]
MRLDMVDRLHGIVSTPFAQIAFGILVSGAAIVVRTLVDAATPGAGPFGLIIPFVLVATLFGRWQAGLVAQILLSLHAWYYVLPISGSFAFAVRDDGPRVAVNLLAGLTVVALGEMFRRAMRGAIDDREALLREVEHRTANNFTSILAMLRIQRGRTDDEAVRAALDTASGRVDSYARANRSLFRDGTGDELVRMQSYLGDLCAGLAPVIAGMSGAQIVCRSDAIVLPRDEAVTLGLLVNEVATNSAKHAFPGRGDGRIEVALTRRGGGIMLCVADNGVGMTRTEREGGMGMPLIEALAKQARVQLERESGPTGTCFRFVSEGEA